MVNFELWYCILLLGWLVVKSKIVYLGLILVNFLKRLYFPKEQEVSVINCSQWKLLLKWTYTFISKIINSYEYGFLF